MSEKKKKRMVLAVDYSFTTQGHTAVVIDVGDYNCLDPGDIERAMGELGISFSEDADLSIDDWRVIE